MREAVFGRVIFNHVLAQGQAASLIDTPTSRDCHAFSRLG
jgi:hypothetical protein